MSTVTLENLRVRARDGDAQALRTLGQRLLLGHGVAQSTPGGLCLYRAGRGARRCRSHRTARLVRRLGRVAAAALARGARSPAARGGTWLAAGPARTAVPRPRVRYGLACAATTGGCRCVDHAATGPGTGDGAADPRDRGVRLARGMRLADRTGARQPAARADLPQGRARLRRSGHAHQLGGGLHHRQCRPRAAAGHRTHRDRCRRIRRHVRGGEAAALRAGAVLRAALRLPGHRRHPRWRRKWRGAGSASPLRSSTSTTITTGGETDFPRIGLRHRAAAGDALLFCERAALRRARLRHAARRPRAHPGREVGLVAMDP